MCDIQCNFKYASLPNLHFRNLCVRRIRARRPFASATGGGTLHTILSTNAPHTATITSLFQTHCNRDVEKDVMLIKSFQKVILKFLKVIQYSFNYHVRVFSDIFVKIWLICYQL